MASIKETPSFWENFLSKERSILNRYFVAIVLSASTLYSVILFQQIEAGAPFTSFAVLSVILSAIYGGKGPAFLDTLITSVGIDYYFSKPYFQVFDSISSVTRVLVYLFVGFLIASLVESLKASFLSLRDQKNFIDLEKRARENVLAVVSHDLRSPVASIIMNADLIQRSLTSGKAISSLPKLIGNMRNSASRMNRLIEDLLDAVKVEAGQFRIEKKNHNLGEVVSASIEESLPLALNKNITLTSNISHDISIDCDNLRLIQVMNNIIGNAVKFSPNDSEIIISTEKAANSVSIKVKDFGPGISPDDQDHLFDRYWQAKSTAFRGTGLGLFITKKIVELHRGKISVFSKLGEGSTFEILLPK